MSKLNVTDKMLRNARCTNHRNKKAVIRVTANLRSTASGTFYCEDCVKQIGEWYIENMLSDNLVEEDITPEEVEETIGEGTPFDDDKPTEDKLPEADVAEVKDEETPAEETTVDDIDALIAQGEGNPPEETEKKDEE